ncbi:MAG: Prolyl endopeptidase, partial [uncultured Quadrisphaera sp.]
AVGEVTVHDLATGARTGALELPGVGSAGGLVRRPEGGHEAWFTHTTTTSPARVLRYDALTGALEVEAEPPGLAALGGAPAVETRVLTATSADGTTVRVLVVAPAGSTGPDGRPDRPRPTVLYGYGGFGVSMRPGYSTGALAWVEAGGVWATAQLRGGGEEGEQWRRDGMLERKQNVFDDHLACARALVEQGWTTPAQLTASGGSNGGLLVGAALTQAPELFGAVLCSAPLLDMVRFARHGLGRLWVGDYGDPERPEDLAWLLAYSPYHRVTPGTAYPATLFTVFDGDSRVDPLHARKMCAALQHATSLDPAAAPVLLRAERDVGHGARAVSRSVGLLADSLAFAAARTGLDLAAPA